MSNAVLISIRPRWCELIASGRKTIEVRKTRPKLDTPFKCYIYETRGTTDTPWVDEEGHLDFHGRGQVIGEFVCDSYIRWSVNPLDGLYMIFPHELTAACLTGKDFEQYGNGKALYGWHISALQIYDKPHELGEFRKPCIMAEEPYCPCCAYGYEIYPDDVETYSDTQGGEFNQICLNRLKRPPQSWCYVEEAAHG